MKNDLIVLEKISKFSLDNPEAKFSFSARLARENGWSTEYAIRVIDEYKKFIYMSLITGKSLTPSDEVDQAWHMHLIYSHSYWVEFCQETLGGFKLHHGPTKGGKVESKKYTDQYNYTLKVYGELFNETPPNDIWPSVEERFSPMDYKRIDVMQNYIINKKKVKEYMFTYLLPIFSIISTLFLMSNTSEESLSFGTIFLWVLGIAGVMFVIRGIYRYLNRNNRNYNGGSSSSSNSYGGCSVAGSFFGCGTSGCSSSHGDSGCSSSSSGCGSSGCGSSCGGGCGGCGS